MRLGSRCIILRVWNIKSNCGFYWLLLMVQDPEDRFHAPRRVSRAPHVDPRNECPCRQSAPARMPQQVPQKLSRRGLCNRCEEAPRLHLVVSHGYVSQGNTVGCSRHLEVIWEPCERASRLRIGSLDHIAHVKSEGFDCSIGSGK